MKENGHSNLLYSGNGTTAETAKYAPLSSVWERNDGELLEAMLRFYPTIKPEPILDATYNAGRFWKGSTRKVVSMDIDPRHQPMIVADNRVMAGDLSTKSEIADDGSIQDTP